MGFPEKYISYDFTDPVCLNSNGKREICLKTQCRSHEAYQDPHDAKNTDEQHNENEFGGIQLHLAASTRIKTNNNDVGFKISKASATHAQPNPSRQSSASQRI